MTAIPVIHCRADSADAAFAAHKALLEAERAAPALRGQPSFTMAKQDAYERFVATFVKV